MSEGGYVGRNLLVIHSWDPLGQGGCFNLCSRAVHPLVFCSVFLHCCFCRTWQPWRVNRCCLQGRARHDEGMSFAAEPGESAFCQAGDEDGSTKAFVSLLALGSLSRLALFCTSGHVLPAAAPRCQGPPLFTALSQQKKTEPRVQ